MYDMEIMKMQKANGGEQGVKGRESSAPANTSKAAKANISRAAKANTPKAAKADAVDGAASGQRSKDTALYGAEADFAVSGRAAEVAVEMRSYWLLEQEAELKESSFLTQTEEKTRKSGRKEETEFQKQLRERLEQARSLDTMFKRMRELNEQAKKKENKKKKVQYSYRRVSAAISGAKTSTQASLALSTASANLSSLKRKA
ncbi:MAG: hypothetical protein IJ733_08270, partial [Lachnospiraceae bacterium]|nr:hypothetical protein [Lachnospiraceae bacterium]